MIKQNFNKQLAIECAILSQQVYYNTWPSQYNLLTALPGSQGFVLSKDDTSDIYVVLRGTQKVDDFLSDAEMKYTSTWMGDVHEGFYEEYLAVMPAVNIALMNNHCDRVIVTGHSLGAALAVLVTYELARGFHSLPKLCYPIALPHVGHKDFKDTYHKYEFDSFTFPIANTYDLVPYLPAGFGYVELMHNIHVEFRHLSPIHNHSIEYYVEAIRELPEIVEVADA